MVAEGRACCLRVDHPHPQRRGRCFVAGAVLLFIWSLYLILCWTEESRVSNDLCERFEDIQNLPVKDECLLRYIRKQLLTPPSKLNYNRMTNRDPSGSSKELMALFGNKTNGFFIECGANDGVFLSNTLALERRQKWTGLLVEAHPKFRKKLLSLNRKAWFANVCLSPYNNISKIHFVESDTYKAKWQDAVAKLRLDDDQSPMKGKTWGFRDYGSVPCFPLVSILAAMNVTHVDFFSLDVEGVELKLLKTLPFDESLTIDVLKVENNHIPEGKEALKSFMLSKGYELVITNPIDYFFKRISI